MLLKTARKLIVGVLGGTVVLIGVIMLVTPGPGLVVIPLGLAILATEFVFAARLLRRMRQGANAAAEFAGLRKPGAPPPDKPTPDPE